MEISIFHEETPFRVQNEAMDVSEEPEDGEIVSDTEEETVLTSKRYDLVGDTQLAVPQEELNELYKSLGIDQENERHFKFNTIYLYNSGRMSSKDVRDFFSGFDNLEVMRVDQNSFYVVFPDEVMTARALLYLSVEIINQDKRNEEFQEDLKPDLDRMGEKTVDCRSLDFKLPKGTWRIAIDCKKSKNLIMRYSSINSAAEPHAAVKKNENPWVGIAHQWGHKDRIETNLRQITQPKFSDLRESLNHVKKSRFVENVLTCATELKKSRSSRKRSSSSESASSEDNGPRRKFPRMQADIEEEKIAMRKLEKVVPKIDLRSRLKSKTSKTEVKRKRSEDDLDDLGWEEERIPKYEDIKINIEQDPLSEEELDLEKDKGQLLQIEINNDAFFKQKKNFPGNKDRQTASSTSLSSSNESTDSE